MARVAPLKAGFNNGEVSPYMYGRVDVQKEALSVREMTNMRAVTQGPTTKRDGTRFVAPVSDQTNPARLFEFEFSPEQGYVIEVGSENVQFFTNRGMVLEADKAVTALSTANPAVVTAAGHGYSTGDQIVFSNVGPWLILTNRVFSVTVISSSTFSLDGLSGTGFVAKSGSPTVARVYSVASPFDVSDIAALTALHEADTLTLLHGAYQPQRLTRKGATDWSISPFAFKDGPYLTEDPGSTTLTPGSGAGGSATPIMTSNTAPSGTCSASATGSGSAPYRAFDGSDASTWWAGRGVHTGWLAYTFPNGITKIVDEYSLTAEATTPHLMPTAWVFEGYDGANWDAIDTRNSETGWASGETRNYTITNTVPYAAYRLRVTAASGLVNDEGMTVATFLMHESGTTQAPIIFTASSTDKINDGQGFLASDQGRSIRIMGSDGLWRWLLIHSVTSTTAITASVFGLALPNATPISRWRLGLFSDTTGWPSCAAYYQNRLALSGPPMYPNYICFSVSEVYDTFTPSDADGTVTEASGFAYPLIEEAITKINWLSPMYRGLIIGTPEGEAIAQPMVTSFTTPAPFSALNIKVLWPTKYGSYPIQPKTVDTATLFIDRRAKRVREMAYQLQADTFVAPDMNAEADHITQNGGIRRVAWQRHPSRILWCARADGCLLGFTYEREEQVTAWHKHFIGGFAGVDGIVEDVAVISSPDGMSEDLWMIVRRGTTRYVEYIGDWFWHDTADTDACFVDAAVFYSGTPVTTLYGLWHLEGQVVRAHADGVMRDNLTVTNGSITLPLAASKVAVGLPYKGRIWTLPPNDGAQNGTSQGKKKRTYKYALRLYRSFGGQIGDQYNHTNQIPYWTIAQTMLQPPTLFSGDTPMLSFPGGWEQDGGTVIENDTSYPFTIIAYMPQIITEDA